MFSPDKIKNIQKMLRNGESFDELATRYSEDGQLTVSFRKGEKEPAYEKAAFELGNEEVSGIVETESGYYIIKCIRNQAFFMTFSSCFLQ